MPKDLSDHQHSLDILRWVKGERDKMKEREAELKLAEADALSEIQDALGEEEEGLDAENKPAVSWAHVTQNRLDQKYLAEKFPLVKDHCTRETTHRTFRVL
jgi:hypothetical protein